MTFDSALLSGLQGVVPNVPNSQNRFGDEGKILQASNDEALKPDSPKSPVSPQQKDKSATSHRWLLHYTDRDPVKVICAPPVTQTQILAEYPDAVTAESFEQRCQDRPQHR